MTRWTEYLAEIPVADLLRSVETPDPAVEDPIERGVRVLFRTVD